jgi:ribosomal protein S18 acetylase RimI-like enzyme
MKIKEINRFSLRIFSAVLKLLPQLDPGAILPTEKHFKRILESERTHLFIVETDQNRIAGMLTIATYDIPTGIKAWIEDVVIDESQRGKGYGRELMLYAIKFAESIGAEAIELTSRPSRISANHLYQKLGFVIRETNLYKFYLK